MNGSAWLVVSDVDHTLLEEPGEIAEAGRCLRRLEARGVATLLASSKTFAEMVALQQEAGLEPRPFLFENGCGIGWAGTEAWVEGGGTEALAATLQELRRRLDLRFTLLAELELAAIGKLLGLDEARARLALQRRASLPLLWQDDDDGLERLRRALAAEGLRAVHGGRLLHVGPPADKGEALERLRARLGEGRTRRLLACGDSENDRELLERAEIALVFHPPGRPPLALGPAPAGRQPLRRAVLAGGPGRWLAAVEAALGEAGGLRER